MTVARVDVLDRSMEKAHVWINDLAEELGSEDRQHAYRVLRAYLHALRDQLSVDEAVQLAAQLPIFIRGVFYEDWHPSHAPHRDRAAEHFLARLTRDAMLSGDTEASFAATAATRVLSSHVSLGETESVLRMLPRSLRELLTSNSAH